MRQRVPVPDDDDLLSFGFNAIHQAYREGKISFSELLRLTHDWLTRVRYDPDEMIEGGYSDQYLDS